MMGPFEEVNDARRVKLMEKMTSYTQDKHLVDPEFWAFMWLSDVDQLELFVDALTQLPNSTRADVYQSPEYSEALRIWATRGHSIKDDPPAQDDGKKRKLSPVVKQQPKPSKVPRCDENANIATTPSITSPGGRSPVPRSRSESLSNIPSPGVTSTQLGVPRTPEPMNYPQSTMMADLCKERDEGSCLIIKAGDDVTKVAYIYPYLLGTKVGNIMYRKFWELLSRFWPSNDIRKWECAVLGPERNEILPNLMCLSPTVLHLWRNAKFALKPNELSEDKKTLTVEFYWLPDFGHDFKDLATPPPNPNNLDSTTRGTRLFDCKTDKCIRSGDLLRFTTDDPKKWPLPSVDLLHMQWVLNRLMSLCGVAGLTNDELDPEDYWS
ncbi:hypothetical protein BJX61DRAFT_68157 [Aspergillus egyptiacus]|nr:hypothetical protein BJX61DRAFT_68157 [Aspergillus egyptiacus]